MAITGLVVTTDRSNYSKYESGRDVITAMIIPTAAIIGEVVTVTLERQTLAGVRVLTTQEVALASGDLSGFSVAFDLTAIKDADGFPTVRRSLRRNDYSVKAAAGAVTGEARVTVPMITVDEMRSRWLTGLPLYAVERLAPRVQPQAITGVVFTDVSRTSALGGASLVLTVTGQTKTLAWRGGAAVTLGPARALYTLNDPKGDYAVVDVTPSLLPGSTTTETLVIDYSYMSDDVLMDQVIATTEEVERGLQVQLEPCIVVSQPLVDPDVNKPASLGYLDPAPYDRVGIPVTYYKPVSLDRWLELNIPFQPLLKVYNLSGYLNRSKVVDISKDWIRHNEKSGHIDLVPSNAAIVQWTFYGAGFYTFTLAQPSLPDFWSYRALVGLREMPVPIIEFIGMRAAIPLLIKAQQARYPAGMTNQSVSRDGVSESRGLNPQGAYAATINGYKDATGLFQGKDLGIQRLRQTYRGVIFTTL